MVPDYDKYETKGGTGKPSRYQLQFKVPSPHAETIPPDTAFRVPPQSGLSTTPDQFAPIVRYYTETVRKARILGHLEIGGFLLSRWRKVMFLSVALTTLLVILAIWWISMIALSHAPDTHAFVRIAVTFAIVASTVWVFVGWFVRLVMNRVTMAPLLLQDWSGHDDRVMELRWDEEHQTNRILIKRYVADCPICEGKVRIQPGRRQFPSRLVGRCGAAPTEHVFSFDPIVRVGIHLHWPHPYGGHRRPDV